MVDDSLALNFHWNLPLGTFNMPNSSVIPKDIALATGLAAPVSITWTSDIHYFNMRLKIELRQAKSAFFLALEGVAFSAILKFFTPYWILVFLLFMPFALRYLSHILTIYIAMQRSRYANGKKT